MAANLLTIENVSKSFTERMLFNGVSLGINDGDKIGVIGINGTGKSTFLKIIAGELAPDEGSVTCMRGLRISYLPQTPLFDDNLTLLENVVNGLTAKESYRNISGEARVMLEKLGLEDSGIKPSLLSGGQRKRAALVRALLTEADLLVLDEPTNHLDNAMTEWLEDNLKKRAGAFIMITHDRYFLDRVTNKIVELDKGNLYSYQTNYSGFLELKAEREEMAIATEEKAKNLYRIELAWIQRGARARSTKQKAHIQRFENLRDREKPTTDGKVEINALSARLGSKTIELKNVGKQYGDHVLFKDFSYILLPGDRVGIIGPNGCGKSTLLNILTGKDTPSFGEVDFGQTVKIGYFSQENEALNPEETVLEYVRETAEYIDTTEGKLSASVMCSKFLFDKSMQYTKIAKLSGGEKRRLYLLKVLMDAPNILVLDEPTNDLDIATLQILEDYLSGYSGIVITVSHDRYFLDKVVKRIFAFEDTSIVQYEGNYSDYKEKADEETALKTAGNVNYERSSANEKAASAPKQERAKVKFSYNEQREFDTIDEDIAKLEEELKNTEEEIANSASQYSKLTELYAKKEELEQKLELKMDRWVYLNDLAEKMKK